MLPDYFSPHFWQAILDEKDRLKDALALYRTRALDTEARLLSLERELKDTRAELKSQLLRRHFPAEMVEDCHALQADTLLLMQPPQS